MRQMPVIRDVWMARQRISGFVEKTPLVFSRALSEHFGASIYLKLEYLYPTGSFKLRGAANKILSLPAEERKRGVATFSTGNHGLAVAYMAQKLGIPVSVFISTRVPQAKVDNLLALGVDLVIHGAGQDDAEENCYRVAAEKGLTVIKPFDDPAIIAGQGTAALELLEQCPQLDTVVIPVSGGGLAGGIALTLKATEARIKTLGVSMAEGAVMYQSLQAGKPVILPETDTLADSLLGGIGLDNRYTFALVRDHVDQVMLVSEEAIARAMAYLYKNHRLVVEGASATTVSALFEHDLVKPGSSTVLILSGNNVDPAAFYTAVANYL